MTERLQRTVSRRALLRGAALGTAGLGALALAGCGGGDNATGTATPSLPSTPTPPPTTPPAATEAATAAWSRVAASGGPGPRRDHSLTLNPDDGRIYVFGGRTAGTSNAELWTFDPAAAKWRQVAWTGPGPAPRFGHNAFYDGGRKRVVIALGQGAGDAFFNDVWAYDTGGWQQIDASSAERPQVRYGAGGAHDAAGSRFIISHGFTDRGRFDDSWSLDLASGAWTKIATSGPVPIKRCLARALWLPDTRSALLFGGQTDATPFLGDLWTLDAAKGTWTERTPSPQPGPRNLYGAILDDRTNRWYVVSGNTPGGPSDETWAYALDAETWSMIGPAGGAPAARYSADTAIASGKLYLFAGHDGTRELDDLWTLDLPA
jgi:hypothetical protein